MYKMYCFTEHLNLEQHSTFGKVDLAQRECEKSITQPVDTAVFTYMSVKSQKRSSKITDMISHSLNTGCKYASNMCL